MEAVRHLEVEIAGYDARYAQASQAYEAARTRLAEVRERIATNTVQLKVTERKYVRSQAVLADRVSAMYRQPQPSQVEVLLRSGSFSDFVSGASFMQRVRRQDSDVVTTARENRDAIKRQRTQLIADQKEAKEQSAETHRQVAEVNAVRIQRHQVLNSARARLTTMIAVEQRRQADAARLAALRSAEQRISRRARDDRGPSTSRSPAIVPVSTTTTTPSTSTPTTTPAATTTPPNGALSAIAQCESGGNATAVSPSGLYRGKYQFDPGTWSSLGGQGSDPAAASEAEQDRVAALLYSQQGASPWPVCGR